MKDIHRDDLSVGPEPSEPIDLKDQQIAQLEATVRRLRSELSELRYRESWRMNPDRMGS